MNSEDIVELKPIPLEKLNANPLVSIIIPTYNRKYALAKALSSALEQSYAKIEIIIADDCSTDGTEIYIKKYLNNRKVKYFKNETNLKFAGNHRKAILYYANGKYCIILSDDDYFINPEYLSEAVDFLIRNDQTSFVGSDYQIFDQKANQKKVICAKLDEITPGKDYLIKRTDFNSSGIFIGTALFDREKAILTNPFSVEVPYADGEFIDKLALLGDVGYLKNSSICYSIHNNNWSSKKEKNLHKRLQEFECADRVVDFANKRNVYDKSIRKYRDNYYGLITVKIYKEVLSENPFNLINFFRIRKSIKKKTGKSYINFLIKYLTNKIRE